MINLHFDISNPWHNEQRWPWRDFYQNSWSVTKNKTLEVCIDFYPFVLAHFSFNTQYKGADHAGPSLSFGLLGFGFQVQLVDNRHWDYETNNWYVYEHKNLDNNLNKPI